MLSMPDDLSIEGLIIDDTFANYCFQINEEDTLFWEGFIRANPSQKEKIAEAMQVVLGLRAMLRQEYDQHNAKPTSVPGEVPGSGNNPLIQKWIRNTAAIAAILVIVAAGKIIMDIIAFKQNSQKKITAGAAASHLLLYQTASGEKKNIILPDSSRLCLNAGSELRIDKGFGEENRTVYLTGEALFDVTHNASLPFIVHIDKFDIKVLGTLFNVKAYPGDKLSETSLIRGKVEISLKSNSKKITLAPNQKAVIDNTRDDLFLKSGKKRPLHQGDNVALLALSYSSKDSMVIETAWTQNRLEIVNESFADMKEKLERWFNVKIIFKDAEVGDYTFSAIFEKETVSEVLHALQNAYHFRYEIKDKEIVISK
jgi:transmembrane sensor